ncbi:UNVERIFIED_CONTAM: protein MAINTENANCE OF MERISTEMS, partial [Sesamum calycinum]
MQYICFAPEEGALKGSRLQVKAIISHISRVQITPDTPNLTVVQYARVVALLLLGGTLCPDSLGNLVSLLYLAKLEDIVAARNYSWGSAVLAFLYRELYNASTKEKAAIGGVLQLVQSRIIPLCPGLGAPRVHMGQHSIDNNCVLPAAPYGAMWNCEHTFTRTVRTTVRVIRDILDEMQYDQLYDMESDVIMAYAGDFNPQLWRSICPLIFYAIVEMHHPERVLRQFGMMQNIPDQPDTRDMSLHKITHSNRTDTDWVLQHILYITRWQRRYDTVNTLQTLFQSTPVDVEGYRQLVAQLEHEVQIIKEAITHQPQQIATPSDTAPTTSHTQRRSYSQTSIGSVERGDIGVDIADPSTAYTPQDYYVPQPPQDYYVPQPSQDDWFQLTSYMPSRAEAYSSHVDLDLGLGINQPYAPGYNISPVPFPSFSAYRDNVESSSAASSSGLYINSGGDDNDVQMRYDNIRPSMAATHNLKIGDPRPICSLITCSPHSSLVFKPPLSANPPKGNASNFFGTTLSRIHSHQNSIPTLSRRLFLPSVSGLWDALTGGNSAREAVIAVRRGMLLFRQGDVLGSLVEFDKAIELDPRQKAYLWQRGLSLYYLNRFEEGAEQFRLDVAQNPNDTEESIWCFLCEAQLYGVDEARRRFLEVGTDPRPVMREAYNMFKDGGDPEKNKSDEAKLHLVAACKSPYGS